MFQRFVPLGSWCRTAHQCRVHAPNLKLEATRSGPFDWTITPFRSLSKIIRNDLDRSLVLNPIDSYVNRAGSITCGYSGLTFHHHLTAQDVELHGGARNDQIVPNGLIKSPKWEDARNRFFHTLDNLREASKADGNLYVRWMNTGRGRGTWQFPEVFDGEDILKTSELLNSCGWLKSSGLLYVTTEIVEEARDPLEDAIKSISKIGDYSWNCIIRERKGFNGDQTNRFQGDEASWDKLFQAILRNN